MLPNRTTEPRLFDKTGVACRQVRTDAAHVSLFGRHALTGSALTLPMFRISVESNVRKSSSALATSSLVLASLHPFSFPISSATLGMASRAAIVSKKSSLIRRAKKSSTVSQYCIDRREYKSEVKERDRPRIKERDRKTATERCSKCTAPAKPLQVQWATVKGASLCD